MMLDGRHFPAGRQQVIEMAFPARRVFALSLSASLAQSGTLFNPAPDARCCLGLRRRNRVDRLHDEPDINCVYRQLSENLIYLRRQGGGLLRGMLGAAPAGSMRCDTRFGTLRKGHRLGRVEPSCRAACVPRLDRISAVDRTRCSVNTLRRILEDCPRSSANTGEPSVRRKFVRCLFRQHCQLVGPGSAGFTQVGKIGGAFIW